MTRTGAEGAAPRRTRDQERALHAYRCVETVGKGVFDEYKVHVNDLGPAVLRSGLAAALSWLERELGDRDREGAALLLLEHLAEHLGALAWPARTGPTGRALPGAVRELSVARYQLVARETLQLAVWFRRAVQTRETHAQTL
jgi:CRISPR-associated protein Cmr5